MYPLGVKQMHLEANSLFDATDNLNPEQKNLYSHDNVTTIQSVLEHGANQKYHKD
jgi:hypothetical protein